MVQGLISIFNHREVVEILFSMQMEEMYESE